MTYEITLFKPRPGEDPKITAERSEEEETFEEASRLDPEREKLRLRIAAALQEANPSLERYVFDLDEMERVRTLPVEKVKLLSRYIDIHAPEENHPIEVHLYDDNVYVTFLGGENRTETQAIFEEGWEYLKIIQRESGFVAYDLQLGIILDLSQGCQDALKEHIRINGEPRPRNILPARKAPAKKWWQFWK